MFNELVGAYRTDRNHNYTYYSSRLNEISKANEEDALLLIELLQTGLQEIADEINGDKKNLAACINKNIDDFLENVCWLLRLDTANDVTANYTAAIAHLELQLLSMRNAHQQAKNVLIYPKNFKLQPDIRRRLAVN